MQQKKVRELLSALVNLVSIAEIVTVLPESNAPRVAFKMNPDTWILFCGQDKINQFKDTVERFWKAENEIYITISKKIFQEKITSFMTGYLQSNKAVNETDIKQFFRELLEIPIEEWEVFRPLHGAELDTSDMDR
jgi:arginine deiminase